MRRRVGLQIGTSYLFKVRVLRGFFLLDYALKATDLSELSLSEAESRTPIYKLLLSMA